MIIAKAKERTKIIDRGPAIFLELLHKCKSPGNLPGPSLLWW